MQLHSLLASLASPPLSLFDLDSQSVPSTTGLSNPSAVSLHLVAQVIFSGLRFLLSERFVHFQSLASLFFYSLHMLRDVSLASLAQYWRLLDSF